MTAREIPGQEAFEQFGAIRTLSRYDRLEDLRLTEDLVPASAVEMTEMMSIRSFTESHGGAAGHIAEVVKHQKKANTNDMHRGPRKIIQLYGDWALDAKDNHDALSDLHKLLQGLHKPEREDTNPRLILDRIVEPSTKGVAEYLRHRHMQELTHHGFIKNFGFNPLDIKYKPTNTGLVPVLEEVLSQWRVHDVVTQLPRDIEREQRRMDFHHTSLLQVEKFYPYLRKTATASIGKFVTTAAVK